MKMKKAPTKNRGRCAFLNNIKMNQSAKNKSTKVKSFSHSAVTRYLPIHQNPSSAIFLRIHL